MNASTMPFHQHNLLFLKRSLPDGILGMSGDLPVSGDYDGDGKMDIAIWRPGEGVWYILPSGAPGSYTSTQYGLATDVPISTITGIVR